ncbi:MAG: hypothetical protein KIS92_12605 [Planctomycetota bacterium]|nr:hypothetical protein [Planctomycetota bacterium]
MASQDSAHPELIAPDEGMGTLMAQITRQWIDRITALIKEKREAGSSDGAIFSALRDGLPDFDKHTLARILALSRDEPIDEDFPAETIAEARQPKPNTVVLSLKGSPGDLGMHSLVRYNDTDWLVLECENDTWTLKLLD